MDLRVHQTMRYDSVIATFICLLLAASGCSTNKAAAMINSSTLENRGVERCITDKIRRWSFPEPKGGGIVLVEHPFVFKHDN